MFTNTFNCDTIITGNKIIFQLKGDTYMVSILKKEQYIQMNLGKTINTFKKSGFDCKIVLELHKMVDVTMGRIEKKLTFLETKKDTSKSYMVFWDGMNKVIAMADGESFEELKNHYLSKGYKKDKQFYTEELGMSEETWKEWNCIGQDEE